MLNSAKNILDKENENIFQYQLQSIGHKTKPQKDDILIQVNTKKYPCPCCGYRTFNEQPNGHYDICEVCFWEDDPIQFDDPDYEGGANPMSLRQAQENFLEFGACERDMLKNVRQPLSDEERDVDWKPFEKK